MNKSTSPRRTLILLPGAGGVALLLEACGGGGDSPAPAPAPSAASPPAVSTACSAFEFSANHGHALSIPRADLDSTTNRTYDIQADAPHNHAVILTVAQLAQLKAGQAIVFTTELGGPVPHQHDVTGRCA